jgi:prepilin-type N-terminal cleavage/methylation domain-containing protein/prepilin-type processing-associated H-X9-DG protein
VGIAVFTVLNAGRCWFGHVGEFLRNSHKKLGCRSGQGGPTASAQFLVDPRRGLRRAQSSRETRPHFGPPRLGGPTRRRGFTLVELLVVVTIIGLLLALLLPGIQSASNVARQTACASNMRQLALALVSHDTSKGRLPGYSQRIPRGANQSVGIDRTSNPPRWVLITVDPKNALPISWATMLLPRLERQDIWDQIVDPNLEPEIRPIELFVCPGDIDALAVADTPALSYSVNAGAPDWDGRFLMGPDMGDTTANGMFFNLYEYAWHGAKPPASRLGAIRDGGATTIMLSENVHKSYEPAKPGFPSRFSWAFGTEQHLGIVWVVNESPQPGDAYIDQERINTASDELYSTDPPFDPNLPRFARPASTHGGGLNVAFCDGHIEFLRDDIDYTVYQQLLTANGRKCVDPRDHDAGVKPPDPSHPIQKFRAAPPLTADDYQ